MQNFPVQNPETSHIRLQRHKLLNHSTEQASFMLHFLMRFVLFTGIIWLCNYTMMYGSCAYYVFILYLQYGTLDLIMHSLLLCNIYAVRCYGLYTGPLGWDSPADWGVGVLNSLIEDRLFIRLEEYIFMPHFLPEYLNFRYFSRCRSLASSAIAAPLQVLSKGPLRFHWNALFIHPLFYWLSNCSSLVSHNSLLWHRISFSLVNSFLCLCLVINKRPV